MNVVTDSQVANSESWLLEFVQSTWLVQYEAVARIEIRGPESTEALARNFEAEIVSVSDACVARELNLES